MRNTQGAEVENGAEGPLEEHQGAPQVEDGIAMVATQGHTLNAVLCAQCRTPQCGAAAQCSAVRFKLGRTPYAGSRALCRVARFMQGRALYARPCARMQGRALECQAVRGRDAAPRVYYRDARCRAVRCRACRTLNAGPYS